MESKKGTSEVKSSKVEEPHHDDWQIDPLAGYKKSGKKETDKKKEDQKKGSMGFDEWSVSWP
ncbi:hypothetical protein [uncultured Pedobacter sp.]|uniref:hypothetical protein n=1 Tax=uncultured Pedobacter sp. TaxID=246139 RepID=UPI0025DAA2D5|nr:hypothetical protein [uncultured Pedobacter sp.]